MHFLVGALPEVQNRIQKPFLNSKIICGAFSLKNGVQKNEFPVAFSKSDLT